MQLEQVLQLLADAPARTKNPTGVKWWDGNQWYNGKPTNVGSYSGRAGSSRRYINTNVNVVAYLTKP